MFLMHARTVILARSLRFWVATTADLPYRRCPEAAELTTIVRWCMGVRRSRTIHERVTKPTIKIRNVNRCKTDIKDSCPLPRKLRHSQRDRGMRWISATKLRHSNA
jgi:hypothetical protein